MRQLIIISVPNYVCLLGGFSWPRPLPPSLAACSVVGRRVCVGADGGRRGRRFVRRYALAGSPKRVSLRCRNDDNMDGRTDGRGGSGGRNGVACMDKSTNCPRFAAKTVLVSVIKSAYYEK